MTVIETDRLILRKLTIDDAQFILKLVNEPSWIRFIGDKGVRTLEDARKYIVTGPIQMYEKHGFGLYLTELRTKEPIGLCGLIKRDGLDDVDIGFAFLPSYWGNGYAYESAAAVLDYGRRTLKLPRIVAIASPDNASSIKLLERLGMTFDRVMTLPGAKDEVALFSTGDFL